MRCLRRYRCCQKQVPREVTGLEYNRETIERGIEQWIIGRNGERDRIVLGMYLVDGITYEEMRIRLEGIGYPLTVDGIKKIVRRRKEQLFRHM